MTIDWAHIHPGGKTKDSECRAELMIGVLKNRKTQVELECKRTRRVDGVDADRDDACTEVLDVCERSLQLDQLLLTRASTRAFIEIQDDFRAVKLIERQRRTRRGRRRDALGCRDRCGVRSRRGFGAAAVRDVRDTRDDCNCGGDKECEKHARSGRAFHDRTETIARRAINCSKLCPEINDRYAGINGKTQGEMQETSPATKAAPTETVPPTVSGPRPAAASSGKCP